VFIISGLSILIVINSIRIANDKEQDVVMGYYHGKIVAAEFQNNVETKISSRDNFEGIPLTADLDLWRNVCQPQDGLIFLKKHKTASTTFRSIVAKWLRMLGTETRFEPTMIGPQSGCFPAKFNEKCWGSNQRHSPVLGTAGQN
jgi:hypothetical protein